MDCSWSSHGRIYRLRRTSLELDPEVCKGVFQVEKEEWGEGWGLLHME